MKNLLTAAVVALGVAAFVGCSDEPFAGVTSADMNSTTAAPNLQGGPITDEQAVQIALGEVAGTVVKVEREEEDGREEVEVEIDTGAGIKSVEMDAATGEVIEIEDEDEDDDD